MKLLFFIDPNWAFGMIHQELVKQLTARGWQADILSWHQSYTYGEMQLLTARYDLVVTIASGLTVLSKDYGVPHEKIIVFAYSDYDITKMQREGWASLDGLRGYAVPSHNLLSISLSMGVTRIPQVLPIGVNLDRYAGPIPKELKVVGYGTAMSRQNHFGVEFKRGELARKCAEAAGLEFRPAHSYNHLTVPAYWQTVDCCLASALYETAPIPQLEAAASGRMVLSSAVGNTAELAMRGIVTRLLPSNERDFLRDAVERLKIYKSDPEMFRSACEDARIGALQYSWDVVILHWMDFFISPPR